MRPTTTRRYTTEEHSNPATAKEKYPSTGSLSSRARLFAPYFTAVCHVCVCVRVMSRCYTRDDLVCLSGDTRRNIHSTREKHPQPNYSVIRFGFGVYCIHFYRNVRPSLRASPFHRLRHRPCHGCGSSHILYYTQILFIERWLRTGRVSCVCVCARRKTRQMSSLYGMYLACKENRDEHKRNENKGQ